MNIKLFLLGFSFLLATCAPFAQSPFSDQVLRPERDLNFQALSEIQNVEGDGKIRIALFSDSHQNYRDLDKAIYAINSTVDVDFVANLGDFTNSAYNMEYDQFIGSHVALTYPALTAIGNHDAIGAGPALFNKVFGPSNFWFESTSMRYIFFNSANLENPEGFSIDWLESAVATSAKPIAIFTHVSIRNAERFFDQTANRFSNIISHPLVKVHFNGHDHVFLLGAESGTIMLQVPRVEDKQWVMVEIIGSNMQIKKMPSGEIVSVVFKP